MSIGKVYGSEKTRQWQRTQGGKVIGSDRMSGKAKEIQIRAGELP